MNVLHVKGQMFTFLIHLWNFIVFTLGLEKMIGAMWKTAVLLVLSMLSPGGDGLFRTLYKTVHTSRPHKGHVGQPLFLTPYIKAGKLKEGKFHQKTTGILSTLFLFF